MPRCVAVASLLFWAAAAFGYSNLGNNTFLTDGSASDTQAAIDAASGGYTVLIPNGTFNWSSAVTISKSVTLAAQHSGMATIAPATGGHALITLNKGTYGPVTLAGINFVPGSATPVCYVSILGGTNAANAPFIVHDCSFTMNGTLEAIDCETNGGIFFNDTFVNTDTAGNGFDAGGINLKNPSLQDPSWSTIDTMGTHDTTGLANTYIENCTFSGLIDQALDFDDNSRTVVRHNTFNDSALTSHGQDSSPCGNRHVEIYNNTWIFHTSGTDPNGNPYPINVAYGILMRGGTGVIWGNVMPNLVSQTWGQKASLEFGDFNIETVPNAIPCQTLYPSARQVGQTWIGSGGSAYQTPGTTAVDGTGYASLPVFVWGNTGGGNYSVLNLVSQGSATVGSSCNNGQAVSTYIQSPRDVVFSAQAPAGYTPYQYPHSLNSGAPAPTAAPILVPAPNYRCAGP